MSLKLLYECQLRDHSKLSGRKTSNNNIQNDLV